MRNQSVHVLLLAAVSLALHGSAPAQIPTAVDDVRITPANPDVPRLIEASGDTIAAAGITLLDLLRLKYHDPIRGLTHEQQVTRFDVVGRIDPPGISDPAQGPEAQRFLLNALLTNHFHLVAHDGQEDVLTEELVVTSGGAKLKPSSPDCSCHTKNVVTTYHLKSDHISLVGLAARLAKQTHIEITNSTDIPGTFAVDLDWSPDVSPPPPAALLPPPPDALLRAALEKQLGLTLLPHHKQQPVTVIDNIELPDYIIASAPTPDAAQSVSSATR